MTMEILAPAGGEDSLLAAVRCGADAVYLGGSRLTARRSAANFDEHALASAVSFCHARGVRVYLTLNTLVLEDERDVLLRALEHACSCGVDALLTQDLAVAALARAACPGLALHASTQMSVHNIAGAKMLERLGFSRVVLARELTLGEIAHIRQNCGIQLETFVHGALCMSVSGQCYLSSVIGGRSGNRGLCAQPCRLPFRSGDYSHALSLRDLSLLDRLDELAEAGVCSVKIEGRMKRPEYVAAAVTACRKAMEGESPDFAALGAVFSRSGFTQGYLDGKRDSSMYGVRQKEDVTAATGTLLSSFAGLYKQERQLVAVDFDLTLHEGEPSRLTARDADGNCAAALGEPPQPALTAPTDSGRAMAALGKTGGTIFFARKIDCDIGPGLMLPASALNALRRSALDGLLALREKTQPVAFSAKAAEGVWGVSSRHVAPEAPELRLRLGRAEQLSAALESAAGMIILPASQWEKADSRLIGQNAGRLAVELPRYVFGREEPLRKNLAAIREHGVTRAAAGSLGAIYTALELGYEVHGDFSLNVTNTVALEENRRLGLSSCTLSFELTLKSAVSFGGMLPRGLLAYGYLPLMALRNCPVKAHGKSCNGSGCDRNSDHPWLTDRTGRRFFVDCDGEAAILYNCVPLWMCDRLEQMKSLDFYTLYFTRETPEELANVLRLCRTGSEPPNERTRGLYYRGAM